MKLSMERSALLRAMSRAQSVVERRNTIPILGNVLIEADGEQVSFRATDLDIEVIDKAPAMIARAGATTVAAHTLHEIARKLPDGATVELNDDGLAGRLDVRAGRSHFSLATLPREDFPIMASAEYSCNRTSAYSPPMPVSAAAAVTARLYWSDAGDRSLRASCSGDAYGTAGDDVYSSAPTATPKSVRYAKPSSSMRMFAGFTSPWTTPLRWAERSALAIWGEHDGGIGPQRRAHERVRRALPALTQAHHQICGTGVAPVVVQRDDVRVLQPGDELGLGLEPADERRIVASAGLIAFDRHLTPDDRLVAARNTVPNAPRPDLLAQLVAPDSQTRTLDEAARPPVIPQA